MGASQEHVASILHWTKKSHIFALRWRQDRRWYIDHPTPRPSSQVFLDPGAHSPIENPWSAFPSIPLLPWPQVHTVSRVETSKFSKPDEKFHLLILLVWTGRTSGWHCGH